MASIEEKVENLVASTIEELGYELYDIYYIKEGKDYFLRIFIDKPEGINLEDCEKVSDSINSLLDKADYIKEQYFLEVSSPGIERILRKEKHLQDNLGNKIEIRMFKPINRKKILQGILKQFSQDSITINYEGEDIIIERKNVSIIKTIFDWEN